MGVSYTIPMLSGAQATMPTNLKKKSSRKKINTILLFS